jgi:hypothetical protein
MGIGNEKIHLFHNVGLLLVIKLKKELRLSEYLFNIIAHYPVILKFLPYMPCQTEIF